MLINELPDDCLLSIFDYVNYLGDLINCYKAFYIHPSIIQKVSSIKQLYLQFCSLDDFKRDAHYLPNLERLHIRDEAPCRYYDGPVLEKLKIFELDFSSSRVTDMCYCFHFMDSCPILQSAYIFLGANRFYVDETTKHQCLQDLVIVFADPPRTDWNDLKRLLMKYPNLKHLGLRNASNLNDEHIKQLLHILPNLVLLQADICEEITERAAYYVQDYCKRHGRSIEFYSNENSYEIEYDWPQLSTKQEKISRGFDFMKHCFLKDYWDLPHFLIPVEY
uniref:F-box domain-containing protein n=1 Tax=Tetranychus urticae TaxID=32264 RepID=T1L698_TETUR